MSEDDQRKIDRSFKLNFNKEAGRNQRLVASSCAGISRRQAILESLSIGADYKIIDVGCGAGYLVEELSKALGDEGRVFALDPSEDQLEEARNRCSGFSNVTFFQGFADDIELENDACDVVTSTQAFEYIKDVDKALAESTRVLKPGGAFVNVSILWDYFRFYGAEEKLNNRIHEAFRAHCHHQMLPMEMDGKLRALGYRYITNRSLAFLITRRDQNSPARYLEAMVASFAVSQGISESEVNDWKRQLVDAETNGRFGFTSYPVLTSAYLK